MKKKLSIKAVVFAIIILFLASNILQHSLGFEAEIRDSRENFENGKFIKTSNLDPKNEPRIIDGSGKTNFHLVVVGTTSVGEKDAAKLKGSLEKNKGYTPGRSRLLTGSGKGNNRANRSNVLQAISDAVANAQPGDEIILYFVGHGGAIEDTDGDEPKNKKGKGAQHNGKDDGFILADGTFVSDDDLTDILKNLKWCVSLIIILDCCWAGHFVDGSHDLQTVRCCKYGVLIRSILHLVNKHFGPILIFSTKVF